jgi:hypothetical protein
MHHSFGGFVDRPVAPCRHDQVRAALDMLPRDRARCAGPGGRRYGDGVARVSQRVGGAPDESRVPSEFSRPGIIDEDGVPVYCDGVLSSVLVKL